MLNYTRTRRIRNIVHFAHKANKTSITAHFVHEANKTNSIVHFAHEANKTSR